MTTPTTPAVEPIVREITVAAPREHAFETFINLTAWWPLVTHTIGKAPARASIIQTRVGGRWYGIDADGDSHEIGHVLVYEPPSRLVLSWEISHDFTYDPTLPSEVEITFEEVSPAITRVILEHRKLEIYGEHAAAAREIFNSEGGWGMLLERFGAFAEKTAD